MNLVDFFSFHTYRMVFLGTLIIGIVAGSLGSFAYLRKQSLIADVVSHAALPGTMIAFLTAVVVVGTDGRSMLWLMAGATIVGVSAVFYAHSIDKHSKVPIDAAMAVTLSLFFGVGMVLMRVITAGSYPGKGGIQDYLFGNASTMTIADVTTAAVIGVVAIGVVVLLFKECISRTFDATHATVGGFHPTVIDTVIFSAIVIATVIGVKAVGLVLMVAFVVTPPAAARQWVRHPGSMVALSGAIGGVGSALGTWISLSLGSVPTGPVIVLTLTAIFVFSLLFAPKRSIIVTFLHRQRARRALLEELHAEVRHGTADPASPVEARS